MDVTATSSVPAQSPVWRVAFSMVKGMNPSLAKNILERVGSEKDFFELPENILAAYIGSRNHILDTVYRAELMEKARGEAQYADDHHIRCLYFTDTDFPQRLLQCDDAPVMLYVSGEADLNPPHVIGIVGTRNATSYGVGFINKLVEELSQRLDGVLIVSGLALGCDVTAHRAAMKFGLPTVGVVAHGLDTIYPAENRRDAAQMVRGGGAVVTDYPHATRLHRGNFLARNRVVAGMCDCLIVAESAAARGGALHTAHLASLYNRDVFALPGRTSDLYSGGCNMLIRKNVASLLTNCTELMEAMRWKGRPAEGTQKEIFPTLTHQQQAVVDFLRQRGEAQINILVAELGIPVGQLMAMMVDLEFAGLVMPLPGARYRLQ